MGQRHEVFDGEENTCVALAASCGLVDLVDLTCEHSSLEVLEFDWTKKVSLNTAVYNSHEDVVAEFVRHFEELKPEGLDYASAAKNLPSLFLYAVRGRNDYIMRSSEALADVDRECRGCTPLAFAVQKNHLETVEYLLSLTVPNDMERRVDVN